MLNIRPPISPCSLPELPERWQTFFLHPGYDDSTNVLFKLYAIDTETEGSHDGEQEASQRPGLPGLYAQFALDACAIITGNRTDGWLSTLRDPNNARNTRVDAGSILHERSYYFHLDREENTDECDDPYPIVPSFREWRFPHNRIPAHWQQLSSNTTSADYTFAPSNLAAALQVRDGSCRISGHREEPQVAHLVPRAELDWWKANDMSRYNIGPADTLDDTTNAILLQAGLHISFDTCRFVIVPKPLSDGSGMRLVFHLLVPSTDYEHFYHNRALQKSAVGVQMLFARFAWSLFPLLGGFLSCNEDRRLTIRTAAHDQALPRGFFAAAFCERFSISSTRKRSMSPKKRKPNDDAVDSTSVDDAVACNHPQMQGDANTPKVAPDLRKRSIGGVDKDSASSSQTRGRSKRRKGSATSSTEHPFGPGHAEGSCVMVSDFPQLAKQWLERERQRSDPEQNWAEEQRWLQEVWNGKTLQSHEILRWLELSGHEVMDAGSDDGLDVDNRKVDGSLAG